MNRPTVTGDQQRPRNLQQCLLPSTEQHYIRTFLFARRLYAPFARIHLIARTLLVLCLSTALLRTINTVQPDLLGAVLLLLCAVLILALSGISPQVARLYILLALPALCALFLTWTIFNPVPGKLTLLQLPVYAGRLTFELALWQPIFLIIVVGYFLWTRRLLVGLLLACLVAFVLARWLPLPALHLAEYSFFHPLTILISDQGLLVALTKVIGYAGMIFVSIALVMTARDIELIGALRQLHIPSVIIFFLSTVFRSLDLALSDYQTIAQAQLARAIDARPRSFLRHLRDLASMAVPMVALMLRRSSEMGDALLARGYALNRSSSDFYETTPWRPLDWAMVVLSLFFFCFAVVPHPTITVLLGRWL